MTTRHRRHGWLWRLTHRTRTAEYAGATHRWSPKDSWTSVAEGAPEETPEERADRMRAEAKAAREREEAAILAKFAEIVHAEFDAAFSRPGGVNDQLAQVAVTAAKTAAVMRKRWKITAADLKREGARRAGKAGTATVRFYRRWLTMSKKETPAEVQARWAAAILEPTGPLPILRRHSAEPCVDHLDEVARFPIVRRELAGVGR